MKPIRLLFLLSFLCTGCSHQMQKRIATLNQELAKTSILSAAFDSIMQEVRTLPVKQQIQIVLNVAERNEETRDGLVKQEKLLVNVLPLGSNKEKKKATLQLIEIYKNQDKLRIPNSIEKGSNQCLELLNNYSLTQEERWEIQKQQAQLLNEQGKQDEYLPIWYQLLEEHRTANKPELIIEDLRAIAGHFNKLNGKMECLDLYKKATLIAQKEHLKEIEEQCLNVLTNLLYDIENYQEALNLCNKAINDSIITFPSSVHSLQAKCYLQLNQPDSARFYLNKMLDASNQGGKISYYCRVAETYIAEEQEDSATLFLDKAIAQYRKQTGDNKDLLLPGMFLPVCASYGSLLQRNGKLQQAQEVFLSIEPLMKETIKEPTQLKLQMDALTRYSALCRTQGKTQEALDLLVYKDSIREVYDTIRKEQDSRNQLAIFQSNEQIYQNQIQKKELENAKRIGIMYLFGGTTIALLLTGTIIITAKLRKRVKQLLKEIASLKETTPKEKKKKEKETPYIPQKLKELFARAEQVVIKQKLFTNKELKSEDVAKVLGVSKSKLSKCINTNTEVNFSDWINQFRIRYIIKRLNDTSQIPKLCKEAGFASQSAFYTNFKKEMGCTPTEYLQKGF